MKFSNFDQEKIKELHESGKLEGELHKLASSGKTIVPNREYFILPYLRLKIDLDQAGGVPPYNENLRNAYWQDVKPDTYQTKQAQKLLLSYLSTLEIQLELILNKASLWYWHHLYRRTRPLPPVEDASLMTVTYVRAIMEAAIQKYGTLKFCDRIAWSDEVTAQDIMNGLFVQECSQAHVDEVRENRQLVLTRFGLDELRELFVCEKIAYEIWRVSAHLRATGKGTTLKVEHDPVKVWEEGTEEVEILLTEYDSELGGPMIASATATLFNPNPGATSEEGVIPQFVYNVEQRSWSDISPILENAFGIGTNDYMNGGPPTFRLGDLNLRNYYKTHTPFIEGFNAVSGSELENITLEGVLCVIAAVALSEMERWFALPTSIVHSYNRAYRGPIRRTDLLARIQRHVPSAAKLLDIADTPTLDAIDDAVSFLTIRDDRSHIQLAYPGPHSMFLPIETGFLLVDMGTVTQRLHYLFYGVDLDVEDDLKGKLLEYCFEDIARFVNKELYSDDGDYEEFDSIFEVGSYVVLAEAKAKALSLGYQVGQPKAIEKQREKYEEALDQAERKAAFLAKHPKGKEHDFTMFKGIIPLAVTPFNQFMPSLDERYWIGKGVPRVLRPDKLRGLIESGYFATFDESHAYYVAIETGA